MANEIIRETRERIENLKAYMERENLSLTVLTSTKDIFYYTGSLQPLYVFVPLRGQALILARKGIIRIKQETSDIAVGHFRNTQAMLDIIRVHGMSIGGNVGLSFQTVSHQGFLRFQKVFPGISFRDISWDLQMLRVRKSEAELACMQTAADKCAELGSVLKEHFRPGMSELELSAVIENRFRLLGLGINHSRQEGADFGYGICSAGGNSSVPTRFDGIASGKGLSAALPFGASRDIIEKNTPILMDFGVTEDGYHVDQTRMAIWGEPCDKARRAFDAMRNVEETLVEKRLKPGVLWQDAWFAAEKLAEEAGYADEFMGTGTEKVKFVGHGVGLELDEPPFLAPKMEYPLEPGMTIAVEPKVLLPDIGIVGIEDTIVITETGAEYLTHADRDWIRL
ncbi:MAG: aminopeptidase P family protein [Spirochaetales bacterium]|nr:aminopeptidase P family protein [Spirochaetales bacterium]